MHTYLSKLHNISIATRVEAIASRLEATAIGAEAIALRLEAIVIRNKEKKRNKLHHRRPQTVCAFQTETRACDAQSWETKDCVQSGRTHLKKELTSPNSKPFGELFFKCEHDAGHAAQSAGS